MRKPEPTDRESFAQEIEYLIRLGYNNGMSESEMKEEIEAQANREVLDP